MIKVTRISLFQDESFPGEIPGSVKSLIGGRMFGSDATSWTNDASAGRREHRILTGVTQSGRKVRAHEWDNDGVCRWSFEAKFGTKGSASFALEVAEALVLALPGEGIGSWVDVLSDMPFPEGRESLTKEDGNHDFMSATKLRDFLLAQEEAENASVEETPRATSQW